MTRAHWRPRFAVILVGAALVVAADASAEQDSLARAKDYYAAASYDEALQVLERLRGKDDNAAMTEVVTYQMYCLVALGRTDEATGAIQAIVATDPLYRPSETDASPRVRTLFEQVRRSLLPAIVKTRYVKAKAHLDRREAAVAFDEFTRVVTLLDEIGAAGGESIADLRTLAIGFRDLSRAAVPPAASVPAEHASGEYAPVDEADAPAPAVRPPAPAPAETTVFGLGDVDVVAPTAVSRVLPPWSPVNPVDKIRNFKGSVDLVIDETGRVVSVTINQAVHADYDRALLRAAERWSFRPATRQGVAVKYRLTMEIFLRAPRG